MKLYNLIKSESETPDSITREIGRYKIMLNYLDKNPSRIKDNESFLEMIIERLIDISDICNEKDIPKYIKNLSSETLNIFLTRNKDKYEYL